MKLIKSLRIASKVVLVACSVSLVGFLVYSGYLSIKAKPRNVVVTNITDSSATVSWVTDIPTSGVVYYDQEDSFLPGLFASFGKNKAYDDRDVSNAQTECVNEFNANNEDFTVEGSNFNCTEVTVTKKGKYYTHHVTLLGLDSETEYSFRFGDGFWSWKDDLHNDVVTFNTPDSVDTPKPMFGRVVTEDEYSVDEDGIVYFAFNTITSDNDSILVSSTTNVDGSWYLDTSVIRDMEGNILELIDAQDVFKISAQFMNGGESGWMEFVYNGNIDGAYPDITVYAPDVSDTELQSNALMRLVVPGYALEVGAEDTCLHYYDGRCLDDNSGKGKDQTTPSGLGSYATYEDRGLTAPGDVKKSGMTNYSSYQELGLEKPVYEVTEGGEAGSGDAGSGDAGSGDAGSGDAGGGGYSNIKDCKKGCSSWMNNEDVKEDLDKAMTSTNSIAELAHLKGKYGAGNINTWYAWQTNGGVIDKETLYALGYTDPNAMSGIMGAMSGVGVGEKSVEAAEYGFEFDPVNGFSKYSENAARVSAGCKSYEEVKMDKYGALSCYSGLDKNPEISYDNGTSGGVGFSCSMCSRILCNTGFEPVCIDDNKCGCALPDFVDDLEADETASFFENFSLEEDDCLEYGGLWTDNSAGQFRCVFKDRTAILLGDGLVYMSEIPFGMQLRTFSASELETWGDYSQNDSGVVMVSGGTAASLAGSYNSFFDYLEALDDSERDSLNLDPLITNNPEQCKFISYRGEFALDCDISDGQNEYSFVMKELVYPNSKILEEFVILPENLGADSNQLVVTGSTVTVNGVFYDRPIGLEACVGSVDSCSDVDAQAFLNDLVGQAFSEAENFELVSDGESYWVVSKSSLGNTIPYDENNVVFGVPQNVTVKKEKCHNVNVGCNESQVKNEVEFIMAANPSLGCYAASLQGVNAGKYVIQCTDLSQLPVGVETTNTSQVVEGLTSKVHAQSEEESYFIYLPEAGAYGFQLDSGEYQTQIVNGEEVYLIYRERNGVEGIQIPEDPENPSIFEDELVPLSAYQLKYKKFANVETIDIKEGINIISLPFLPVDADGYSYKAFDLLDSLRSSGVNIRYMAQFEGGKWNDGFRCEGYNECTGENFDILPGQGYLILAENSGEVSLPSYELLSPIPVELSPGWNLIGINGYTQAFTAKTFLQSVNKINGLTADNMTWWPTSKGKYEGIQLVDGLTYGLDYAIDPENGYFVRISEFSPSNEDCKSLIWQYGGELNGSCGNTENIF